MSVSFHANLRFCFSFLSFFVTILFYRCKYTLFLEKASAKRFFMPKLAKLG